ncbi:MAG TPA: hypothetical protein DCQ06_09555 [Myxococcales bacterium]|nr:hypothetical protein [Myxococcales bacterium]
MKRFLMCIAVLFVVSGCQKTEHEVCADPHSDTTWVYIWESNGMWSEDKCVACDNTMTKAEISAWISKGSTEGAPCRYVYSDVPGTDSLEKASDCQAMVCVDEPNTGDVVNPAHGAWKAVGPIINPSQHPSHQSLILPVDERGYGSPTFNTPVSQPSELETSTG